MGTFGIQVEVKGERAVSVMSLPEHHHIICSCSMPVYDTNTDFW